jgi:hypothetical protein
MKPKNLLLTAAGPSELEGYSATLLLCTFMLNVNILINLFPICSTYFASHTIIIMRDLMFQSGVDGDSILLECYTVLTG